MLVASRGSAQSHAAPVSVVPPEIRVTWNSSLPYSLNDGPMWAGRGLSFSITGGAAYQDARSWPHIRVVLAPTLWYSQNRPFEILSGVDVDRSTYASPFHGGSSGSSMDLPLRFGDRHLLSLDPGRSSLTLGWSRVATGVSTENEWWGPGMRNALVVSNNAAGIPRFFVRTVQPVRTRLGDFRGELIAGALTQSMFFSALANENRTISGLRVELRPARDTNVTLGFARVVYAPLSREASLLGATLARSLDAIGRWENLAGASQQRSDQIGAVYVRWSIPRAGFELYGEWARMALPENATELLTAANYSGAWTAGFQLLQPRSRLRWLRLQSEFTYLEQSRLDGRPGVDFYSGQGSPQGFTQRGQVIGAAIGPGGSSQWIASDWMTPRWRIGGYVGRIRWENDAMYRLQFPTY